MRRSSVFICAALLSATVFADDSSWLVPLNDLGTAPYRWGYYGGLYENGSNAMAADHFAGGLEMAARIQPRAADGTPSANGKIGFLAVGFGETKRIMSAFTAMAARDPRVERDHLVLLNAARDGADYRFWDERTDGRPQYDLVAVDTLAPAGITPMQVQVAWVQVINDRSFMPMGVAYADAYRLENFIAGTVREMKRNYPNLQIAYLTSRVYGGYSTTNFNPEPFAYETGFSNRWLITNQIEQERMEHPEWETDIRSGLIDYRSGVAPWLAWGPYLWANGEHARSDGLAWLRTDFEADGETLSPAGAAKAGGALLNFLLREPTARSWFLATQSPRQRSARH